MKLSLLFVAILGVATVAAIPAGETLTRSTRSLSDDWADFYALIDTEAVLNILIQYLAEDPEVQHAIIYMQSDEFKALILAIEAIPEYIEFLDYLDAGGLNVYHWVNRLHSWLGLSQVRTPISPIAAYDSASPRITGGIAGLWKDLKATLPLHELRALFEEKLQTSQEFADLIGLLTSEKAQTIYASLKANEEYQYIRAALVDAGIDVDFFFDWIKALISWT